MKPNYLGHKSTFRLLSCTPINDISSPCSPPSQLNTWIMCFSVFCSKSLEFTIRQYPWISVTFYFQTSSKNIILSFSLPLFSCLPCLRYLRPCTLILIRLWRYISHVLTYLLSISQPESWHSFYHPMKNRRLSWPRHCSKGVRPVPKLCITAVLWKTHKLSTVGFNVEISCTAARQITTRPL